MIRRTWRNLGEAGEIAGRDKGACWVSSVRKFDTLALDLALKGRGFSRAGKVPKKSVFLMLFSCERLSRAPEAAGSSLEIGVAGPASHDAWGQVVPERCPRQPSR